MDRGLDEDFGLLDAAIDGFLGDICPASFGFWKS